MAAEIEEVRRKIRLGEFGVSNVSLFSFNHDFKQYLFNVWDNSKVLKPMVKCS